MPQPCGKVKKKPYGIIIPQEQSPERGIFFYKEQRASVCAQRSRDKKRNEQLNINYKTRHSREGGNPLRRRHFYAVPAGQ